MTERIEPRQFFNGWKNTEPSNTVLTREAFGKAIDQLRDCQPQVSDIVLPPHVYQAVKAVADHFDVSISEAHCALLYEKPEYTEIFAKRLLYGAV